MDELLIKRKKRATARLTYRREPWDSGVLGLNAFRVSGLRGDRSLYGGLLAAFLRRFGGKGSYVIVRLPTRDTADILAFDRAGFYLVNSLLEFKMAVSKGYSVPRGVEFFRPADEKGVLAVTKNILKYAKFRFQDDPCLPKRTADRAVLEWTKNCCRGERGDLMLVKRVKGRVAGFIVCQKFTEERRGNIDLLAVRSDFQGKNFGKELLEAAFAWFRRHRLKTVSVASSLSNTQAANFYYSFGFHMSGSKVTMGYYA